MFSGYRTYITAGLAALTALGAFLVGDVELEKTLNDISTILVPVAVLFLRAAKPV